MKQLFISDILNFLIEARANTYAGNAQKYNLPFLPGSKEMRYDNGKLFYHDRWFDDLPVRPGNFAGMEIISLDSYVGKKQVLIYTYAGGLTDKGLKRGDAKVYDKHFRHFLKEQSSRARLGNNFAVTKKDEEGVWEYKNKSDELAWGWEDHEVLSLNGIILHTFRGQGILLIKDS